MSNHQNLVSQMRLLIERLVAQLPNYPQLGPEYSKNPDFEPSWLRVYRIKKSFFIPEPGAVDIMHQDAVNKMIGDDSKLTGFSYDNSQLRFVRRVLYQSRLTCEEILAGFKVDMAEFDISSGETYVSARGRTSLLSKLKRREQWTITADAVDFFAELCYSNRGLKQCALEHIKANTTINYRKKLYKTILIEKGRIGFSCFKVMLIKHLLTIVPGSRCETVPKNNTVRRTINVEPWLNVICQRVVSHALRKCLKRAGNDLEMGQDDHRMMIANPTYSTIDFSNASNSTATTSCRFMLPPRVFNLLCALRSEYVLANGSFHCLNMLSAMGNGFTFEVMTVLLLSVARTLDKTARVYGDDVIIKNRHAKHFIEATSVLGYEVNESKTFVNSPFRESCGAYYHDRFGYIQSFDFKPGDEDGLEPIVWVNKLAILAREDDLFVDAYKEALSLFEPSIKGPFPPADREKDFLSAYVWNNESKLGLHKADTAYGAALEICQNLQYDPAKVTIVKSVKLKPVLATKTFPKVKDVFRKHFYLYSGRRVNDVIRNEHTLVTTTWLVGDGLCGPLGSYR